MGFHPRSRRLPLRLLRMLRAEAFGVAAMSGAKPGQFGSDWRRCGVLRDTSRAMTAALPPARTLRVLHLEDSEPDHALVRLHLQRRGLAVQLHRVDTRAAFEAALAEPWDAIVSDYNLPGLTGIDALRIVREGGHRLPFILVSGTIGEDTAVAAMRDGASDYLLKNNLARLAPALEHAIAAASVERARDSADRELQASRRRLSELAQHLQTSIEQERAAIAREIHDDVGGSLTALKFELDWVRRHAETDAMRQRALTALETVSHALEASQRVMHNLRPAILDQGLDAALQWLVQRFEKRTGIACTVRGAVEGVPLPPGVALVAYRTAQEALTNVSKHAQAQSVQVELSAGAGVLTLEVADDGRGLTADDLTKARSFGIRGLHERAGTVGGWVDLGSGAQGTTLTLSVPLSLPMKGAVDSPDEGPGGRPSPDGPEPGPEHDPSAWGALV